MKTCRRCVLPESFPGLTFDGQGVCRYCQDDKGKQSRAEKKLPYRRKFLELLSEHKGKAAYDGLLSYSGGQDSTYTLCLLREKYDLNILAYTFDNGFLPDQTLSNIKQVTRSLQTDFLLFSPSFDLLQRVFVGCAEKDIYPEITLMRASTICTSCMALVKFSLLRLAVEKGIPFIFYGWSPGQIPISSSVVRQNPEMTRAMQRAVRAPLERLAGPGVRRFFLEDEHFRDAAAFPTSVSPLAFLDYDHRDIRRKIAAHGWRRPSGLDANSSNCLLNSYANVVHREKHGFHPYAFELAKLVREGYLERGRALAKLRKKENKETLLLVKDKLGLR